MTARHDSLKQMKAEYTGLVGFVEPDPNFGYTVQSFEKYRDEFAACFIREFANAGSERRAEDAIAEIIESRGSTDALQEDILPELLKAVGMSREEQTRALKAMGEIAESMQIIDKYDILRVYAAIAQALPTALTVLREIRTKNHPNATGSVMRKRGAPIVGAARADMHGKSSVVEEMRRQLKEQRRRRLI